MYGFYEDQPQGQDITEGFSAELFSINGLHLYMSFEEFAAVCGRGRTQPPPSPPETSLHTDFDLPFELKVDSIDKKSDTKQPAKLKQIRDRKIMDFQAIKETPFLEKMGLLEAVLHRTILATERLITDLPTHARADLVALSKVATDVRSTKKALHSY